MRQRQSTGRVLRRNHSNALPSYIIAYHAETKTDELPSSPGSTYKGFRIASAISARYRDMQATAKKVLTCLCPADFWSMLERTTAANYTTWVVGHNILQQLIVSEMPSEFEQCKMVVEWPRSAKTRENNQDENVHQSSLCVIDNPPTIIAAKCVKSGGRVVFVDLLNWFQTTLPCLAESGKQRLPSRPESEDNFSRWENYCNCAAEVVFSSFLELMRWVKDNDMGMFRYTAPSQSMAAYRHRYMTHQLYIHDNEDVKQVERASYFGGRTEIFKMGRIQSLVHQLDVNSLFPYIMSAGNYPSRLDRFCLTDRFSEPPLDIDYAKSVATVEIDTQEPIYPVRHKRNILYPIGRFKTTLCGQELANARMRGQILKVASWAEYELNPIFNEFVAGFWAMRQAYKAEGNELYDMFAKKMMNSLYGKFGQRSPAWVNVPHGMAAIPWSQWTEYNEATKRRKVYRSFGWQTQEYTDREEIVGTFVAISSFITSAARMYMNELRSVAGTKEVYYQGVDSLIVTDAGYRRLYSSDLVDNESLGRLRHQLSTSVGEISGYCDYTIGQKNVISGLSANNYVADNGERMQRLLQIDRSLFSGVSTDKIEEYHTAWQRISGFTKGTEGQDGWTSPFVMTSPDSGSIGGESAAC